MRIARRVVEGVDRRIWLVALSLLAVLWLQAPDLTDEFVVIEDFGSFYWMNQFREPGLFPNDQLRGDTYTTFHLFGGDVPLYFYSLGYGLLFYAASFLVSPILFAKLLPFLLAPITVLYLLAYGTAIRDRGTGTVLAVGFLFLNLASPNSLSITTGLQRSFASPLIFALLYYLHRRDHRAAGVVTVLSALFYSPVFLLAAATWAVSLLLGRRGSEDERRFAWKRWAPLLVAVVVGVAALSPVVIPRVTGAFAADEAPLEDEPTYDHLWENPRYQMGGRSALFKTFPIRGRAGLVTKKETVLLLMVLPFISSVLCLVLGRRAFDLSPEIWALLLASLAMFLLAWVAVYLVDSFLLYLPSRYTRVGLFLFFSTFVLLNLKPSVETAGRGGLISMGGAIGMLVALIFFLPPGHRTLEIVQTRRLLALVSLFLTALVIVSIRKSSLPSTTWSKPVEAAAAYVFVGAAVVIGLVVWGDWSRAHRGTMLNPHPEERALLRFLRTLPKDVQLAGTPCALDSVPLLARRQVLFNCESISRDKELMRRALDAYYAEDPERIVDFCHDYGVDYLVIDSETYTQGYIDRGEIFFEPYNEELLPRIRSRETFVLAHVRDEAKIFQADGLFVVPCTEVALQR